MNNDEVVTKTFLKEYLNEQLEFHLGNQLEKFAIIVNNAFQSMENRYQGLEGKFEGLENRFERLERKVEEGFKEAAKERAEMMVRLDRIEAQQTSQQNEVDELRDDMRLVKTKLNIAT